MKNSPEFVEIDYPDLPVSRRRDEIQKAIRENQVVVVVGDTGSGKTTQLPKMAWEVARESVRHKENGVNSVHQFSELMKASKPDFQNIEKSKNHNLPHWKSLDGVYAVTFRLKDSIPQSILKDYKNNIIELVRRKEDALKVGDYVLAGAFQEKIRNSREEYLEVSADQALGECWLKDAENAQIVIDSLNYFDGDKYNLGTWCVMPNHVHLLIKPIKGFELNKVISGIKKFSALKINKKIGREGAFWMQESYDHLVRGEEDLLAQINYIEKNPSKAGITQNVFLGCGTLFDFSRSSENCNTELSKEKGVNSVHQFSELMKDGNQNLKKGNQRVRRIGCTQPRRIAASSVAKRVSEELNSEVGSLVGYQVRFQEELSKETPIKFMTDGILLAESQGDPLLRQYHTLIIDEAHERSLNIDFILGYLNELRAKRPDLKIIISSATLDAERFSEFFGGAPIITVEGRTFPVEDHFLPAEEGDDLVSHVLRGVEWVSRYDSRGDVLIFLQGEREIRQCTDALEQRQYANTDILPLYARLSLAQQNQVFTTNNHKRRIVLSTNVAETSLTIPGIVYVIDSGWVRMARYLPSRQIQRLQDERVSQASARQRRGRCGRVREGVCLKLYSEEEQNVFPEFTDPEIKRSSLAGVILRMKYLKLPEIRNFSFIDPPSPKAVREGENTLDEIGALDEQGNLTEIGQMLARLPLDPRLARMLIEGYDRGVAAAVTVIVAGMSVMDIRERPAEKAGEADQAHAKFKHLDSDFMSLLMLWNRLLEFKKGKNNRSWQRNQLRQFCKKNYLSFRRVLEWDQVLEELRQLQRDQYKWRVDTLSDREEEWGTYEDIHKALFVGIPTQIGNWDKENRCFRSTGNRQFFVFPGSGLFGKKYPEWVMVHELVETSKLWARKVAKIDPKWIEELVPWGCRYRHHSPYWDAQQGAVYGKENVFYSGLLIVQDRRVHYGRVNPKEAHQVFISEAILENQLKGNMPFMKNFLAVKEEVLLIEHKLRQLGQYWMENAAADFFIERVPVEIHSAKSFHQWRKTDGNEEKLMVRKQDIMWQEPEGLEHFPDTITHNERSYPVYYRTDPGAKDDGVTIGVTLEDLSSFPDHLVSWGVPGLYAERAGAFIRTLPKDYRAGCQPIRETSGDFMDAWLGWEPECSMQTALADFLRERTGYSIVEDHFTEERMAYEWKPKVWVYDEKGKEVAFGEDILQIKKELEAVILKRRLENANAEWEMSGATYWDFGEIIELPVESGGVYPALVAEKSSVGLKAFLIKEEAEWNHRRGCVKFFRLNYQEHVLYLEKNLPLDPMVKLSLGLITSEQGKFLSEIINQSIEGALVSTGGELPRNGEDFDKAADRARGELHASAESISRALEEVISLYQSVIGWCEENAQHRFYAEVAEDICEEVEFLTQRFMMTQFSYARLMRLPKYFQAIEERIEKLNQQAFKREEERLNMFKPYWDGWFSMWKASKGGRKNQLHAMGELLEDWRVTLFAPSVRLSEKVSKKMVEKEFYALGLKEVFHEDF